MDGVCGATPRRGAAAALCEPWSLATFPAPDEKPESFRVLFYTCAGGHEAFDFLPPAVRNPYCNETAPAITPGLSFLRKLALRRSAPDIRGQLLVAFRDRNLLANLTIIALGWVGFMTFYNVAGFSAADLTWAGHCWCRSRHRQRTRRPHRQRQPAPVSYSMAGRDDRVPNALVR
jgi:hypothetical protein